MMSRPLTRSFDELKQGRITSDANFRDALLRESIETVLGGEFDVGKVKP